MTADGRREQHRRHFIVAALIFIVTSVAGGCLTVDPWEDARIEAEVKAQLVAQKEANLTRLGVVSRKATVYLSGTVESADQKTRAETVAKEVRGVRGVVDTLTVRSAPE